eukprot:TRINITY_DN4138_c0_g1_i2.p1 TRINITY_DN4138_c0_g1~~TRINITY_DN4138_c0_g1_i2.p1  ORF type:complete len:542 (+),score=131.79 TRINITY_DN4138_c0_g1_i2:88-1713(+)
MQRMTEKYVIKSPSAMKLVSEKSRSWVRKIERGIVICTILYVLTRIYRTGAKAIMAYMIKQVLRRSKTIQNKYYKPMIDKEANSSVESMVPPSALTIMQGVPALRSIPAQGYDHKTLINWLNVLKTAGVDPHDGKMFAYAYATNNNHEEFLQEANNIYIHQNALNPFVFPALRKFETEVVRMTATMLNGDDDVRGNMTSGGSESILMAVKTYRDMALAIKGIEKPEMIVCISAHPAFDKAAHYFGVKTVKIQMNDKLEMDVDQIKKSINKNTMLIVASAPQYPHGIIDPIRAIAAVADTHNIPLHVDACIGGFILPWIRKLGYDIPDFGFEVPEVTSISVDVHKFGYSVKGASVILYRDETYRQYQFFTYSGWTGGFYISPTMQGTRGGGSMACAWSSIASLGEEGYMKFTKDMMETFTFLLTSLSSCPHIRILGNPKGPIIAFTTIGPNIFTVCDVMESSFGYHLDRQQNPACVHLTIMPIHMKIKQTFIDNLLSSIDTVLSQPSLQSQGSAAMYGMVAKIPSEEVVEDFLVSFLSKVYN